MSEYVATIRWQRGEQKFIDDRYSRAHQWEFDGGVTVPASASPGIVPLPMSVAENVDPEEAFVASLSSCHMLFFLSLVAKRGVIPDEYFDAAVGYLGKSDNNKLVMTRVILRPKTTWSGEEKPSRQQIEKMHHRAHDLCFIANSVTSEIVIELDE